jgi:hypothetical protein
VELEQYAHARSRSRSTPPAACWCWSSSSRAQPRPRKEQNAGRREQLTAGRRLSNGVQADGGGRRGGGLRQAVAEQCRRSRSRVWRLAGEVVGGSAVGRLGGLRLCGQRTELPEGGRKDWTVAG